MISCKNNSKLISKRVHILLSNRSKKCRLHQWPKIKSRSCRCAQLWNTYLCQKILWFLSMNPQVTCSIWSFLEKCFAKFHLPNRSFFSVKMKKAYSKKKIKMTWWEFLKHMISTNNSVWMYLSIPHKRERKRCKLLRRKNTASTWASCLCWRTHIT